jgi:uncharacterized membrane protein
MIRVSSDDQTHTLVLHPNRSMSWGDNRTVIAAVTAATLLVPTLWAVRGLWLALPLAGIGLLALAIGLYYACWKLRFRQVIRVAPDSLTITEGHYYPKRSWQLDRQRAALAVEQTAHPWDAIKISLYDRHQRIAVGEFLNKQDCETLLASLVDAGLRVRSNSVPRDASF